MRKQLEDDSGLIVVEGGALWSVEKVCFGRGGTGGW
jgi:hypothetical protein